MQVFNREGAIEALVRSDMDYILQGDGGGLELLESVLKYGTKGYDAELDTVLCTECMQRDIPESEYLTETVE